MRKLAVNPIRTEAEYKALETAARADQHGLLYPTHTVLKAGEIVGYGSVFGAPIVNAWMHRTKCNARDTVEAMRHLDELVRAHGRRRYIMSCAKSSPYFPFMERLGFQPLWENMFFVRDL